MNKEADEAFRKNKEICAEDALLCYPNYNERFVIHIDASDYQMEGVISQNDKAVAYWSKKLSGAQRNYTTTEKELLAMTEILKEYRDMLYGQESTMYTDHANLAMTHAKFICQRVLRQRLTIEEFGLEVKHISGEKNIAADALSRIDFDEKNAVGYEFLAKHNENYNMYETYEQNDIDEENVPIDYETLHTAQWDDIEYKKTKKERTLWNKNIWKNEIMVKEVQI